MPPTRSGEISGTNMQGDWRPGGDLGAPPHRRPGLGVPEPSLPAAPCPGLVAPRAFPIGATHPLRMNLSKSLSLPRTQPALPACSPPLPTPPSPHLLHPSEVNSSENFPWEQFPLLIMPAALAQLLLSGSLQQGRRLTLAWNSRGDGGGGGDSWDYDKGWQAIWYASPGHTLSLPYWGDKDDFPCWSLSVIKTKHSNAVLRFKLPPPPTSYKIPPPPKKIEPSDLKEEKN